MKHKPTILLLIPILSLALTLSAQAISLTFDLGSPRITGAVSYRWFDELEGTELLGQEISLDINFTPDQFVRIYSITTQAFQLALDIQTDYDGMIFDMDLTGYVTGKNGKEIKNLSSHTGGWIRSDGSVKPGLFPLYNDEDRSYTPFNPNIKTPFDIYGVHFDLTLANLPGFYITQSAFQVNGNNDWYSPEFGTAFGIGPEIPKDFSSYQEAINWHPSVPDTGSTLTLLGMALTVLAGATRALRIS